MLAIQVVKLLPVAINLYILLAMSLYIVGVREDIAKYVYPIIGQSFLYNAILYWLSSKLRFCFWHRLLIINMSFGLLLEALTNYGVNVGNYAYLIGATTVVVLFVSWLIYQKYGCFNQKKACENLKDAD
jgi:hypothetical protein